jgi:H+/gluconate symporter-like permease
MPFFGTTPFAAPGLGLIASVIMLGFGLWWLARAERVARRAGIGPSAAAAPVDELLLRERASTARDFDPAEMSHGAHGSNAPPIVVAMLPLGVVVLVNLLMSLWVLPRLDTSYLAELRFGGIGLSSVAGVWSVALALGSAIVVMVLLNRRRLPSLRASMDAGANAAVLPIMSVASLVGFGAVVAAMPAFEAVRDAVLGIGNNPLVTLAIATNSLAALTGSASGGLTIALDTLGTTLLQMAAAGGIDPALMHRVAVIGAGTLDSLPHNGAVVTLLALCGVSHKQGYVDIVMAGIVGPIIALVAVIGLGTAFGSF